MLKTWLIMMVVILTRGFRETGAADLEMLSPLVKKHFGADYQKILAYLISTNSDLLENCGSTDKSPNPPKRCLKAAEESLVKLSQNSQSLQQDFIKELCTGSDASNPTAMYLAYKDGKETGVALYNRAEGFDRTEKLVTAGEPYSIMTDKMGATIYTIENSLNVYNVRVYSRDQCSGEFKEKFTISTNATLYYLVLDPLENFFLTGDYEGGHVFVATVIEGHSGQTDAFVPPNVNVSNCHPQWINFHPIRNNLVGVAYSGLDVILLLEFDAAFGTLASTGINATLTPGSAPSFFVFSNDAAFLYVVGTLSHKIIVFKVIQDELAIKGFKSIQEIPCVPDDYSGVVDRDSHIYLHPNGQFVYALSYGFDSVAIYRVNTTTGELTSPGYQPTGGKGVDALAIAAKGDRIIVPNYDSNVVTIFAIDKEKGDLTAVDKIIDIKKPGFVFCPTSSNK